MPKNILVLSLFFLHIIPRYVFAQYQWAVVGAGLAGVTSIAVLLENGVDASSIIWIDPEFNMGRMGKYYRNVPANTKFQILKNYFRNCPILQEFPSESRDKLFLYDQEEFPLLDIVVNPLIDATNYLRSKVNSLQEMVISVISDGNGWILECRNSTAFRAQKVILAIGGYPKKLDYRLQEIPLDEALDKDKLATYVSANDSIAVFGGMHSAMLLLKYLSELGVKEIFNFYTTPYQYRIQGAESLEGETKLWVKNVLEQKPPANLKRMQNTQENLDCNLPLCNKVIYAIGFERNPLCINGKYDYECDNKTGIIAPNLYGIGMAFPHTIKTLKCNKVAINGFVIYSSYARNLIPMWIELASF